MTDAVPARMFARTPHYNNRAERQHSVVTLPLVAALVEPGSRYSLDDPRIAPPAPTRRPPPSKPSTSSSHRPGRQRGTVHAERPERDPLIERLIAVDEIDTPIG